MNFKEKLLKIKLNKKLFLKIYITIAVILAVALIILQILGSKSRVGYLSEFDLLETNYNENITNYIYHFKIGYYNKIFKHSDIYEVYPDLSNLPEFVKEIKMDEAGSPFGNLISDRIIEEDKIDNINYTLKTKKDVIISIVYIFCILVLILFIYFMILYLLSIINIIFIKIILNKKPITEKYYNPLTTSDKKFIILTILIALLLLIFQFWLGFPGFFNDWDTYVSIGEAIDNVYNNWHAVIIALTLHFLYKIFGIHSYYLFLINLILFYTGLVLIIISLYLRFKTKKVLALYLLIFIKDLFFMNFNQVKDSIASMFIWLLYSLVFFQLFVYIKNKYLRILLRVFTGIILLFALLWRHNFIVAVYPVFILFTYLYLKNKEIKSIKTYIKSFALIMLLSAFILISIFKIFPYIWIKNYSHFKDNTASNPVVWHQIAGCSVPANDNTLIPLDWYVEGKTFEDVKKIYNEFPLSANDIEPLWKRDALFNSYNKKFNNYNKNNLKKVWIKSILKHPLNYIKHINRFFIAYCSIKDIDHNYNWWIKNVNDIQMLNNLPFNEYIINTFDKNEQKITFTPIREKIYSFLFNSTIHIPRIFCILISFIIFIINFTLIFIKKIFNSDILIYSFSVSFSTVAIVGIVILFTPIIEYRYIYPVYPLSIISLISFLIFMKELKGIGK